MKNIKDDVLTAFNKINTPMAPVLLRRFTFELTGATGINIKHYDWDDIDSFGDAQSQIEFIKTIARILSDDVTAELIRALQGVKEDSNSVRFINSFNMVYNSVAVTFTVVSRSDKAVLFNQTVDLLKDETENKTPQLPPAQHGKIVDHVAGILTYCALSSKYCENMHGFEIKSRLIELVGPDIVEDAIKKVTSL